MKIVLVLPVMQDQRDQQEIQVRLVKEAKDQPELQVPLELQAPTERLDHPDPQARLELMEALEKRVSARSIALLMVAFFSLKTEKC